MAKSTGIRVSKTLCTHTKTVIVKIIKNLKNLSH